MSTVNRGIVNTGLVLCLDAANPNSIVSGNTVWNDLSVSTAKGTLVNTPTFNTSNGGSIVFNGTSQFIRIPNESRYAPGTGDFTIEWYQYGGGGSVPRIMSIGYYAGGCTLALSQEGGNLYHWVGSSANGNGSSLGAHGTLTNLWTHFIVTRVSGVVRGYKNGVYMGTAANNTGNASFNSARYFTIGVETSNGTSGIANTFLNGRICLFRLYVGKGFSQAEVTQNYNVSKLRFGL